MNPQGLLGQIHKFSKGYIPWNKGLKTGERPPRSKEWCEKISLSRKGKGVGINAHQWKGENVGYVGLHRWVYKMLGKPMECELCNSTESKRFEWANKSHKYKRDINDWIRLCAKCHKFYDKAFLGAIERRYNFI